MHIITGIGKSIFKKGMTVLWILLALGACKNQPDTGEETQLSSATNVTVTQVKYQTMKEKVVYPATVVYLNKSNMNASLSGFLTNIYVVTGDYVKKGAPVFQLETKEHSVIKKDSSLKNQDIVRMGIFTIRAPASGYITSVNHQKGDFVQEGASICSFTRDDQMYVKAFIPIDMNEKVQPGNQCRLILHDSDRVDAKVKRVLNEMDPVSQSLQVLIKPAREMNFSEYQNMQVEFISKEIKKGQVLPLSAVLSSEKLDRFWVMKLIDDTTAVKVPVKPGIRQADSVAILSPIFQPSDRLLTEGNYGLPDTAKVNVMP